MKINVKIKCKTIVKTKLKKKRRPSVSRHMTQKFSQGLFRLGVTDTVYFSDTWIVFWKRKKNWTGGRSVEERDEKFFQIFPTTRVVCEVNWPHNCTCVTRVVPCGIPVPVVNLGIRGDILTWEFGVIFSPGNSWEFGVIFQPGNSGWYFLKPAPVVGSRFVVVI